MPRCRRLVSPAGASRARRSSTSATSHRTSGDRRLIVVRSARKIAKLETQSDLTRAVRALVKNDPRLAPVLATAGIPAIRRREPGFEGLARIIVGQQVSTASANAIWGRVFAAFDPFHPQALRRATATRLGRLGLSAAKIKTLKLIAAEIGSGRLDLESLATLDADTAHAQLIAQHGI